MDPTDTFFTQTIVGAPFSVLLGRRQSLTESHLQGLEIDPSTGENRLTRLWHDWIVLNHDGDSPGKPRQRPGPARLWMERHALWLAVVGLVSLLASLVVWGAQQWK